MSDPATTDPQNGATINWTVGWDSGTIAWILTSTALVFMMTLGLAFFYGSLCRDKHIIDTVGFAPGLSTRCSYFNLRCARRPAPRSPGPFRIASCMAAGAFLVASEDSHIANPQLPIPSSRRSPRPVSSWE